MAVVVEPGRGRRGYLRRAARTSNAHVTIQYGGGAVTAPRRAHENGKNPDYYFHRTVGFSRRRKFTVTAVFFSGAVSGAAVFSPRRFIPSNPSPRPISTPGRRKYRLIISKVPVHSYAYARYYYRNVPVRPARLLRRRISAGPIVAPAAQPYGGVSSARGY